MAASKENALLGRFSAPSRDHDLPQTMESGFPEDPKEDLVMDSSGVIGDGDSSDFSFDSSDTRDLEPLRDELVERIARLNGRLEAAQRRALIAITSCSILQQLSNYVEGQVSEAVFNRMLPHNLPSPMVNCILHRGLPSTTIVTSRDDRPYVLLRLLGIGGFSTVWEVWDFRCWRRSALKIVAIPLLAENTRNDHLHELAIKRARWQLQALVREISLLRDEKSPHLLSIHDHFSWHNAAASLRGVGIVMPLCRSDVASYLKTHPQTSAATRKRWLQNLFAAIQYVHQERRVLHMDLKPHNLLIALEDEHKTVLGDFGLHKELEEIGGGRLGAPMDMRDQTHWCGTLLYQPPEHLRACLERSPDYVATCGYDIWSAGCIAHEILLGEPLIRPRISQDDYEGLVRCTLMAVESMLESIRQPSDDGTKNFIRHLLLERPSAAECLAHPFFS